jgi:hypothetical protein
MREWIKDGPDAEAKHQRVTVDGRLRIIRDGNRTTTPSVAVGRAEASRRSHVSQLAGASVLDEPA